jgi:hypothetical protein
MTVKHITRKDIRELKRNDSGTQEFLQSHSTNGTGAATEAIGEFGGSSCREAPIAADGAATENRELVIDEPPAAICKDRRAARETFPGLLAFAGGEPAGGATV